MQRIRTLNAKADVAGSGTALIYNINAAKALASICSTNLGPSGTLKMLVGGAGDIKLSKDGKVLLSEMQLQNPTAQLIARTATAQDDQTGDGTTSAVLIIGELMRQAERYTQEKVHPRVISDGFGTAKERAQQTLETLKIPIDTADREILQAVARSAVLTKLRPAIGEPLTDIVTDAVLTIQREGQPIDLFMIEMLAMRHKTAAETRLVRGLVLDHGARHPDMKKFQRNVHVLTCNVSFEYEKTEVNSQFFYSNTEDRLKMADIEKRFVEERCRKVIALKEQVCTGEDDGFIVINQKGIDPHALQLFQEAGIVALRRAKRRNMERTTLACGGTAVNSVDDLTPDVLGFAGQVYEQVLGEDKFTFIEEVQNPFSCTILVKGPNNHTISMIKDAVRDGVRAVKNAIDDGAVMPGGAAVELALYTDLMSFRSEVQGRARLGVQAFAEALLVIPKTLASNSGFDLTDTIVKLEEEHEKGNIVGLDVTTGEPMNPADVGVYDCYAVKRQLLHSSTVIAANLLLVDEMLRAGKNLKGSGPAGPGH